MKFKRKKTERGFQYILFQDKNDKICSIQESSIATDYCLWLGVDRIKSVLGFWESADVGMHLTQSHAKKLIKHLQKFVDTGHL